MDLVLFFYAVCWQIRGRIEWRCADFAERVGEKMKNCDFIQKNACILFFAVIVYSGGVDGREGRFAIFQEGDIGILKLDI